MAMTMRTEEQAHVDFLKEKAEFLGLTFDQYMLFLIFETLDHASVLNNEPLTEGPWEEQPEEAQEPLEENPQGQF